MKKLFIITLMSLPIFSAYAQNETLRCTGLTAKAYKEEDIFFYDGETITMIGGGTQDRYVPFKEQNDEAKIFENNKYLITINKNRVSIETEFEKRKYTNVTCDITGE